MPAIADTNQSRSPRTNTQKIQDTFNAVSLMKYFDPFMDWFYGIALCLAIFKDISDFVGLGSLPVIGTLITFAVSFTIGLIMFLTGSGGKRGNAKRIVKSLAKRYGTLVAGTGVEMFFGLNFFPIETAMVAVVFYLTLQERMLADKDRAQSTTPDSSERKDALSELNDKKNKTRADYQKLRDAKRALNDGVYETGTTDPAILAALERHRQGQREHGKVLEDRGKYIMTRRGDFKFADGV